MANNHSSISSGLGESALEQLALLINLIDLTNDAFHVADESGNLIYVNERATKNLGYSREEMLKLNVRDFESIFQEDEAWNQHIKELEANEDGILIEGINTRKDGTSFPVEVNVRLISSDAKRYVVAVLRDITERNRAKEKLVQYQEELDEAQLLNQMGSFEFDVVSENITWSKNAPLVFDLPHETDMETLDWSTLIHPEDYAIVQSFWEDALKKSGTFSADYRVITRSGETRYIQGRGKPVFDESNTLKSIVGTCQDVTEVQLAQRELKASEEKYRNLLENLNLGLMEVDNEGKVLQVFERFAQNIGYSQKELLGTRPHEYLIEADQVPVLQKQQEQRSQGKSGVYELRVIKKDGSQGWLLISAMPTYDSFGKMKGSIGVHMDITERKQDEQRLKAYARELESINKELDQFAYIVSHDLKAPLRAINNLSSWIQEDLAEQDQFKGDIKQHFGILQGRVQRMENLINGILEYSRVSRFKRKKESVDCSVLLREIIDSIHSDKPVEYIWQDDYPVIRTERVALQQVLANLISNAVKYNNKPQIRVEVTCVEHKDHYEWCVRDNGPGIDPQYHEKIFQIFQTLQARDHVESTGVELAIVKKTLDEIEQTITLDSELGQGSTFCFTWPKNQPEKQA